MEPSITALGHAGFDIRLGGTRLVCDPWMSERGAYLATWHPFPANAHLDVRALADTPNLYLSSPHPDRFDVETVAKFPREVRVIVPALPSRALADRLAALGFTNVVELEDGRPFELGGDVKLELATGAAKHHLASTLVLEAGGDVVVHQSDPAIDAELLARLAARRPALHFLPFSGASYLPAVFEVPAAAAATHLARELGARLERFVATATAAGARYVVPIVGPAALDAGVEVEELEDADAPPVDTKELRAYLRDVFQFEDMTYTIKLLVEFRIAGGPSVWVDFRKRPVRFLAESEEPAGYRVTVEGPDLALVMQGKLTWRELLMARRVKLWGEADPLCRPLLQHFDYRHDEQLFDFVRRLDPPLITLDDGEMEYVCQRFCPHRGRDLEYATIERGKLTCTAHGWRFDLRNGGRCLWGGETPLIVKSTRSLR